MPFNETCIPSWYHSLELGSALLSVAANALLAYLVICWTPNELKVYGRVLLCNCLVDLVYTTASFVIELSSTPLFVAIFPILACVICITFSVDWLGRLVELATRVLSYIPIMNPTFTIIFVKSYIEFVFGAFVKKRRSVVTPAPSAARVVSTDMVLPGGLSLAANEAG